MHGMWGATYRNEYRMLHNESPAPYEGRHRVPDADYYLAMAYGDVRQKVRPHTPRHSAEVAR